MSKEPTDGQVAAIAVFGILGIIILTVLLMCFGIFALYASITSFVAGNVIAGILWGLYPWLVLSGGSKAFVKGIKDRK